MTAHPLRFAGSAASSTGWHWLAAAVEMAAVASGNWPLSPQPAGPRGWTCLPRISTRTLCADARSVRAARDFTGATLQRWGVAERSDDIAVVASELLTNALRHALPPAPGPAVSRWPIRFGLLQPGPCVLCVVADPSLRAPVRKEPSLLTETGRGLHVIEALADMWGYTTLGDTGKVVWALFSARFTGEHPPPPRPRAQIPAQARAASRSRGPYLLAASRA
jgi:hypothetical protein